MIRPGFLDIELRQNLIELARDGLAAHRLARRANALVLLDDGMSCEAIAKVLLLDDDTIRTWYRLYEGDGIEGLTNFSYEGSACQLSGEQQEKLKAWVATALPRTTRQVGAWIENEFGVVYEGRSGLIALLHRLGLEYHKPNVIPRKLDEEKQKAFIEGYEKLLNSLGDDEAVLFADAVHPTHAARPVGCWAPSQEKLAIEQTSGRQRINIHGAIDLETGQTRMIEALTIDAASTIRLLQSIEAFYPMLALIHVFLDNARYHHAKLVQEWLALPGRRIKLHFIPTYCPHLNPIERLWGLMHRNVTHNKCYATCAQFADATLSFLREKVPGNWADLCDSSPTISASSTQRIFGRERGITIPHFCENPKTPLAKRRDPDFTERMIRPGFLDIELRQNLIELARDGLAAHRLARRANALVLLDDGMSCQAIAKVLLLDDDTIRTWYRLYEEDGIEGLTNFSYEGSACQLSGEQQEKLKAWVATALPRTTRQVGAWIENEFGVVYEGRSGLIALLHRLGLEYHKPNVIPRKLDEEKQKAFIEGYEKLLNSLGDDEAVLFADAVHPTHAARPVGCWAPSQEKLAIEQTSGRQRINIHGAIDLQTGQTRMIEALTIDAASTIRLLQSIEALYPMLALIHVFLDNARYHHAKLVQEWLALPGRRIKLHFIPTYCPHLNPIERLWGLMHRNVTHNKCYATCAQFADATLSFLREKVPGNWADLCDLVTDNFRVINPKDFRVMT